MDLKCKKCKETLELVDIYDTDGGLDEGYLVEKRFYNCEKCNQDYTVGINKKIEKLTEKDIIWFDET